MLILAVDTSSPAGSLAVLRDDRIIGTVSAWTGEIYSSRIFRQLAFLLGELSLRLEEFDLFAVAVGPGSFTGLRVGLAAVKGWAEVYRKPVAAVSALEAVAAQSHSRSSRVASVLDARRGQVYFAVYKHSIGASLIRESDDAVATPQEFLALLESKSAVSDVTIATPVPELLSEALSRSETGAVPNDSRFPLEQVSPVLAPYIGLVGLEQSKAGQLADSLTLDANYVRRSDAELHWKAPAGS